MTSSSSSASSSKCFSFLMIAFSVVYNQQRQSKMEISILVMVIIDEKNSGLMAQRRLQRHRAQFRSWSTARRTLPALCNQKERRLNRMQLQNRKKLEMENCKLLTVSSSESGKKTISSDAYGRHGWLRLSGRNNTTTPPNKSLGQRSEILHSLFPHAGPVNRWANWILMGWVIRSMGPINEGSQPGPIKKIPIHLSDKYTTGPFEYLNYKIGLTIYIII